MSLCVIFSSYHPSLSLQIVFKVYRHPQPFILLIELLDKWAPCGNMAKLSCGNQDVTLVCVSS